MPRKPWISKCILVSIKKKQKLHKVYHFCGFSKEKLYYKRCNNLLTKIKTAAKKFYFTKELKLNLHDPSKMWKILREILPSNKQQPTTPSCMKINDSPCSNLELITHAFNDFFINVGSKLTKSIKVTLFSYFVS